jgi:hypothetical protein
MNKLASKATMSSLDAFLNCAVRRVIQDEANSKPKQ